MVEGARLESVLKSLGFHQSDVATLVSCLGRARVEVAALTAKVVTHVSRNPDGRYRIAGIDVDCFKVSSPTIARASSGASAILEDYCTVTGSVRQGVPVKVAIRTLDAEHDTVVDG